MHPILFVSKKEGLRWRKKERTLQHSEHLQLNSDQREVGLIPDKMSTVDTCPIHT